MKCPVSTKKCGKRGIVWHINILHGKGPKCTPRAASLYYDKRRKLFVASNGHRILVRRTYLDAKFAANLLAYENRVTRSGEEVKQ